VKRLKAAVIGTGTQGRTVHVNSCMASENIDLVAICDVQKHKLDSILAEHDIPYSFTDYHDVLAMDEVEAVIIALPNYLHAPVTIDALNAGKHVLVEKPMATNAEEAAEMVAAKNKSGKKLLIGQNNRFRADSLFAKDMIESGECGEVYNCEASWWRRRCGQRGWFIDKERSGGGALVDIGVHALDLSWWLMGCPQPEYVLGVSYEKFGDVVRELPTVYGDYEPETEFTVDDLAAGFIKFTDGRSLYIGASWAANTDAQGIVVKLRGTRAGIVIDDAGLRVLGDRNGTLLDIKPVLGRGQSLHEHYVDCVRGKEEVIPKPEHGHTVMKMLDAIYKSSSTGDAVRVD